jgi:hypothetical protein
MLHTRAGVTVARAAPPRVRRSLRRAVQLGDGDDGKVVGEITPEEIAVFLWMCWVMVWSVSAPRIGGDGCEKSEPVVVLNGLLSDVWHLVLSLLVSVGAVAVEGVKVQEFTSWVLSLALCAGRGPIVGG